MSSKAAHDSGVVLVNVLVVLAIAATLVYALTFSQDSALQRARSGAAAAQARALAAGAEASVLTALRRDLLTAPEQDHLGEPWAAVAQDEADLATGRFSVEIRDLRGKFDLNRLARPTLQDAAALGALFTQLGLPAEVARGVAAGIAETGPLDSIADLGQFGLGASEIGKLAEHADALPLPGPLNLNTASAITLTAILGNPIGVRRLVLLRDRQGYVTADDLAGLGLVAPPRTGFTSDLFEMTARAEVDGAETALTSRFQRVLRRNTAQVNVISRRTGLTAPAASPDIERLLRP